MEEAKKQHYKERGKVHSVEQFPPTILVNDEKLKDPINVANAFNSFFITITEHFNIQQMGERR